MNHSIVSVPVLTPYEAAEASRFGLAVEQIAGVIADKRAALTEIVTMRKLLWILARRAGGELRITDAEIVETPDTAVLSCARDASGSTVILASPGAYFAMPAEAHAVRIPVNDARLDEVIGS